MKGESQPPNAEIPFASLLSNILDQVGATIQRHIKVMQELFCPGAHLRLMQDMQEEVDSQLTELLRRFVQDRDLVKLSKLAKVKRTQQARKEAGTAVVPFACLEFLNRQKSEATSPTRSSELRMPTSSSFWVTSTR